MTSQYTLLISFVILFAVTIFAFRQLAHFFEKVLDKLFLGWVNNVMGGLLYSFFVVFVASLCLWLINKTELISNNIKKESKIYSYLEPIAPKTIEVASAYVPLCKDLYEKINITLNNTVGQIAK